MVNALLGTDPVPALDEGAGISLISTFVTGPVTLGSGGYASSLTITNTGTVATPPNDAAIAISGIGLVVNAGLISADGLQGTGIDLTNGTVINSGDIYGNGAVGIGNGTVINSGVMGAVFIGNGVVVNSGLIEGFDLDSVNARYGLTLVMDAGSKFEGSGVADVASGNGTLILSAGIQYMPLYGFRGFSDIDVSADPGVVLSANGEWPYRLPSSGTTLTGFQLGDILRISADYPATYVPGEGIILSNVLFPTRPLTTIALENPPAFGLVFTTINNGVFSPLVDITPAPPSGSPGLSLISTLVTHAIRLGENGYADSLTITSAGEVEGYIHGPCVYGDGTLINAGLITNSAIDGVGVELTGGTLINTGKISDVGVRDGYDGTIINSGAIYGIGLGNGVVIDSGGIGGSEVPGITAIYGLTLVLQPGFGISGGTGLGDAQSVEVGSGTGTLVLSAGIPSLSLYGFRGFSKLDVSADTGITLDANNGWLQKLPASGTTLAGFQLGDTLQVPGADLASYVAGEGIILSDVFGAAGVVTIALSAPPADGLAFTTLSSEAGSYVDITAPCFCAGTRIRTPRGEVAVEDLRIGDEVTTAFAGVQPIKWIGQRSYEGRFIAGNRNALPVCLKEGAIAEGIPVRDLWVSPDHAICEGGVLIHAWRLVNGVSVVQAEAVERVEYFHIELEGHHVLFAEGCPAESFRDADCRQRFANAHEYAALYGEAEQGKPCLPLIQGGFHLDNIRRRLAERAGIAPHTAPPGPLRGCLDESGPERLRGWAQDLSAPEVPVMLSIMVDGKPYALLLANEFRADLRAAGLGSGCHAFSLPFPPGANWVEIRRASDGAVLAHAALTRAA